jgi:hypothetical protein
MDFGASSTVFAPVRVGLEVVLAPTATPTCQPRIHALKNRQDTVSLATCGFIGGDAGKSLFSNLFRSEMCS